MREMLLPNVRFELQSEVGIGSNDSIVAGVLPDVSTSSQHGTSSAAQLENPLSIKPASTLHGVVFVFFFLGPCAGAEAAHPACKISAIAAPAAIVPSLPPTSRVALPSPIAFATAASIARAASS